MDFEIISDITNIEIIATGTGIRNRERLQKQYGKGKWRKMNYPAASGRGIRIKIDSIVDFGVAAGILYLVLLHISLSYLHPHA
ncbi:hypothetical protein, partial [Microcystis sp. LE19-55.1A]|uniref:hypothetical protein n=1 Tax=Microcystis sp. LE19-55.1A TaxID=3016436 RepID=UPI0022C05884